MGACDMAFNGRMLETRTTSPIAGGQQPTTLLTLVPLQSTPAALVQPTATLPCTANNCPTSHGRSPPHSQGHCFLPLSTKCLPASHWRPPTPSCIRLLPCPFSASTADSGPHEPRRWHTHVPTFFLLKKNYHLFVTERWQILIIDLCHYFWDYLLPFCSFKLLQNLSTKYSGDKLSPNLIRFKSFYHQIFQWPIQWQASFCHRI